jgi:hypothetical protein
VCGVIAARLESGDNAIYDALKKLLAHRAPPSWRECFTPYIKKFVAARRENPDEAPITDDDVPF